MKVVIVMDIDVSERTPAFEAWLDEQTKGIRASRFLNSWDLKVIE